MPTTTDSADGLGMRQMTAERINITLTGVAETLMIPLLGRAVDATTQSPVLADPYAKGVMEKLDYDFAKLPMPPTHAAAVALRTRFYDRWTAAFLATHPRATVLHLACGLDSRNQRVEWGPDVRWIDVDLPEVVALRRQVLPASLDGRDYRLLSADITEDAWLERIPADRPVVVVMEGLLSYLQPKHATGLLKRLVEKLKEGELHFDCMKTNVMTASAKDQKAAVNQTGAAFKWAVDNLKDVEKIHPRLGLLEVIRYLEAPGVDEFPFLTRIGYYLLSWVPGMRDSVRFVRFGFSEESSS
ncbi:S-adenosyl-L-methionine-dependent methyltransferase [Xylaria telfairii]|nr:S-adenosyl-L-methionine-dependent methyltransferase [Xylaria telfairii]